MHIRIYKRFETFRNCSLFCTFWLLQNFNSGDAHQANYAKHSLNHHFQYCAHCVYDTYSVLKLFEIAVCFAHFGFYEISTLVVRTKLTMVDIVQIIISNIAHIVYMIFTTFSNFSKLLGFVFAHFGFYEISTLVMRTKLTMVDIVQIIISNIAHTVYMIFTALWNFSKLLFVLHILAFTKFQLWWCAPS